MKTQSGNTKTPWTSDKDIIYPLDKKGRGEVVASTMGYHGNTVANAKFIVKAVNSHDDLIKAINTALFILFKPNTLMEKNTKDILEKALKESEA